MIYIEVIVSTSIDNMPLFHALLASPIQPSQPDQPDRQAMYRLTADENFQKSQECLNKAIAV